MQGTKAYANSPGATPPVDSMQGRDQNLKDSTRDINLENTNTTQNAFEVSITQEARDILAAQAAREPVETQTKIPEDQTAKNSETAPKNSQIMNIVA